MCRLLLDTGATRTIIRPEVSGNADLLPARLRLKTATGECATVYGELKVQVTIGSKSLKHQVVVADVSEEVILGIDLMKAFGFSLDFRNGVVHLGQEEVVVHRQADTAVRVILTEDVVLPKRSEKIVLARLDGNVREGYVGALEPKDDQSIGKGVLIGKGLIQVSNSTGPITPVRLMNINDFSKTLKRGTEVGNCEPVSIITRVLKKQEQRR